MIIDQCNPSPGIVSARLQFPVDDDCGSGTYSFALQAVTLQEPRLISTCCYNEPWFAIRVDLSVPTGELLVMLGRADDNAPHSQGFLLPRYIKDAPEHTFEVTFRDWKIVGAAMNDLALQPAPSPTEVILIHQGIEQLVSACDLLRPNGTVALQMYGDLDSLGGMPLFLLQAQGYYFQLSMDGDEIVLQRSGYEVRACPDMGVPLLVWALWSPTQLQIMLPNNKAQAIWSVTTSVAVPPKSLRQLARTKKLQPTTSFASMEAFRTAVHEALCSLQDDIMETGAYNGFWDQRYEGRRKGRPTPKHETDIHRSLLLLLQTGPQCAPSR